MTKGKEVVQCDRQTDRQTRFLFLDVAKGLLILSVVLGHLLSIDGILPYGIKAFIYSFHMPAFFIISGILTNPERIRCEPFAAFAVKKAYRLLIPYVFFELTGGLWQMLIMGTDAVNPIGILYSIVTIHPHVGADWFLPTMFMAELLLWLVVKAEKKRIYPFVILGCFAAAFLIPDLNHLVVCFRRGLVALAFLLCGILGKQFFVKHSIPGLVLSGMAVIMIVFVNGIVDLYLRQFGNPLFYIAGGILGTYWILNLSHFLSGRLGKTLSRIGRSSLIIMGTHQNVQVTLNVLFGSSYTEVIFLIASIATIIYEFIIVSVYEKYVPFFVGIRKN